MSQAGAPPEIRLATLDDVDAITHLRWLLFIATGRDEDTATRSIYGVNYAGWLRKKIARGEYIGWVAQADAGEVVSMVGLWLMEWQPTLTTPDALQGFVVNVYTLEAYRRQGLARRMMGLLLDECRRRGIKKVALHASADGRPLYETLGFKRTNEMRLELED